MEWLTDDDNRELEDEIEAVNYRMLDKLLETSALIAVFFCMYTSTHYLKDHFFDRIYLDSFH